MTSISNNLLHVEMVLSKLLSTENFDKNTYSLLQVAKQNLQNITERAYALERSVYNFQSEHKDLEVFCARIQ